MRRRLIPGRWPCSPQVRLEAGDVLVILGARQRLEQFEAAAVGAAPAG